MEAILEAIMEFAPGVLGICGIGGLAIAAALKVAASISTARAEVGARESEDAPGRGDDS